MLADDPSPGLRVSDAEREAAVDRLREHAAAGRLDTDELDERVAAALAALTGADLAVLERDLPAPAPAAAPARRRPRVSITLRDGERTYLAVMALLVAIWALSGAGYFWPVWPAVGWGFALLAARGGVAKCGARRRRDAAPRESRATG